MKNESPFNSGWFYILLAVLLVILGVYLKLRGSEGQVMIAGFALEIVVILALLYIVFKKKKKRT